MSETTETTQLLTMPASDAYEISPALGIRGGYSLRVRWAAVSDGQAANIVSVYEDKQRVRLLVDGYPWAVDGTVTGVELTCSWEGLRQVRDLSIWMTGIGFEGR